ncbi:MAG: hypothetical protein H6607_01815 [Flavobacteriales bacterium]|nr:hypothetical protein [Flavobacteriales bacterium]
MSFLRNDVALAQNKAMFGLGFGYGNKCLAEDGGLHAQGVFFERVNLSVGVATNRYGSRGFSYEIGTALTKKFGWNPWVGFSYIQSGGVAIYMDQFKENEGLYHINGRTHYNSALGVRKNLYQQNGYGKVYFELIPYISYRTTANYSSVIFVEGVSELPREQKMNDNLNSGFGFGAKFTVYFGNVKVKEKKTPESAN